MFNGQCSMFNGQCSMFNVQCSTVISEAIRFVEEGIKVTLPVDGNSMLPFIIGGKESAVLQKPGEPKVGDVVLAWTDGSRYVIHRIIKIEGERVTLMGDGNLKGVEHCSRHDIKALVTHIADADGKQRDLYTSQRKLAARVWRWLKPVRRYLLAIYRRTR